MNNLKVRLEEFLELVEINGNLQNERGTDLYKAICIFHTEKTPSMTIHFKMGGYFCFSCGASGKLTELLEELEK